MRTIPIKDQQTQLWGRLPLKTLKVFEKNGVIRKSELMIAISEPAGKSYWYLTFRGPCIVIYSYTNCEVNTTMLVCFMMVFNSKKIAKNNYTFRPIATIFRLLQFCSKSIIYIYVYI